MNLNQSTNKVIDAIERVNAGDESAALSMLGLPSVSADLLPKGSSFLSKVVEIASKAKDLPDHNSSILVSDDCKMISDKELVDISMTLQSSLTEDVWNVNANVLAILEQCRFLCEGTSKEDRAEVADKAADIIGDNIVTIKYALIDLFSETAKLHISSKVAFNKAAPDAKDLYVSLVGNAVTGSGIIYAIHKIDEWKEENEGYIGHSMNTSPDQDPEVIAEGTYQVQSSLVEMIDDINAFYNSMTAIFESADTTNTDLDAASDFIGKAVDVAKDCSSSPDCTDYCEKGLSAIAALYDQYLQDIVALSA